MKRNKKVLKAMAGAAIIVNNFIGLSVCPLSNVNAQGVGINPSGNAPDPSAMFDVSSTTKGTLITRMTTAQRDAITSPANSLLIYNTTTRCFETFANSIWQSLFCTLCPLPSAVTASATPNPVCAGATLILTSSGILATGWSWSGPNGFTSTLQSPTISNITAAANGVYILTASNSCGAASLVSTASVTINTTPSGVAAAASPNPVCTSATLTLTGSATGATSWSWSGPNSFASTLQSPTISGITTAANGAYTLIANNSCGAATPVNTASVTVNVPPTTANAGVDINPACGVTTATLSGNIPSVGIGNWSVVSGTATITTPGSPTSGVTGLAVPGTATLRWTISNSPCASSGDDVIIISTACFPCGNILTITHTAGAVAPVTKTVNYGTVSTTLGGTGVKCWITQNLGASNQATSATDGNEAVRGWYWQFNRKQGYKHDGTTRTPNTTWITSINENSDWTAANDPCTIELGAGWRIPTYTEWNNADANGPWNNYTGTYNSVLKVHAANYLSFNNGNYNEVDLGYYWSSTQLSNDAGGFLMFYSGACNVGSDDKATGLSLRCLKD